MKKRIFLIVGFLLFLVVAGFFCKDGAMVTNFSQKNQMPSFTYPFGTDWMGRNLFLRTIRGLSISICIGMISSLISCIIALCIGTLSAFGGKGMDAFLTWCMDVIMGVPHILLLLLLSLAMGRDTKGVILGIAMTHWTTLARLVRSELLQIKEQPYIKIAAKLGQSKWAIFQKHLLPNVLPQYIVGSILLFPHAILHESSITFLGFGLSSEQPAIGILLAESMRYLVTGKWWLAVFPGISLVFVVSLLYQLGEILRWQKEKDLL